MARPDRVLAAVTVGLVLDLGISGLLWWNGDRISHQQAKLSCWAHVLDTAVKGHVSQPRLLVQAKECAALP